MSDKLGTGKFNIIFSILYRLVSDDGLNAKRK